MSRLLPRASIHSSSIEALGVPFATLLQGQPAGTVNWPANNDAIFVPFAISRPVLVKRMFSVNGSAVSGNIDVGIYTVDGARIVSIGSTAQSGTNALQFFNITDTPLSPGRYFMACALSSTSGRVFRYNTSIILQQQLGVVKMATAFALPSSATFATVTTTYVPQIGMELASVL